MHRGLRSPFNWPRCYAGCCMLNILPHEMASDRVMQTSFHSISDPTRWPQMGSCEPLSVQYLTPGDGVMRTSLHSISDPMRWGHANLSPFDIWPHEMGSREPLSIRYLTPGDGVTRTSLHSISDPRRWGHANLYPFDIWPQEMGSREPIYLPLSSYMTFKMDPKYVAAVDRIAGVWEKSASADARMRTFGYIWI